MTCEGCEREIKRKQAIVVKYTNGWGDRLTVYLCSMQCVIGWAKKLYFAELLSRGL